MENENDIDQLFRRGLEEPEIPFNELDWEKMERKLDAQKPKRLIPVWMIYTADGIAAVLAVFMVWILFSSQPADKLINNQSLTKTQPKPGSLAIPDYITKSDSRTKSDSIIKSDSIAKPGSQNQNAVIQQPLPELKYPGGAHKQLLAGQLNNLQVTPAGIPSTVIQTPLMPQDQIHKTIVKENIAKAVQPAVKENKGQPVVESDSTVLARKANALAKSKDVYGRVDQKEIEGSVRKRMENALTQQQHELILSAMAAPDITSTSYSKSSKVSTNLGMTATYAINSKFSLTSGAVYSKKYYNYDMPVANNKTWAIDADCNVLDIPLNVNYKLMNKKKLSVSVNTGLSSYFMLKEKYQVTSGPVDAQKVTDIEVNNENQHIFGIANVSLSFDHQITESISIGVQPFAKLPLTGIGHYDTSLKSAGVSFSLNIGLFPSKKPGKYAAARYSLR